MSHILSLEVFINY